MRLKRTGITTKIIICILAVWAVTTIVSLRGQISRSRQENQELSVEAADLAGENEDMSYVLENSGDDDVIRDIARDELGLGEPGEEVYYAGQQSK